VVVDEVEDLDPCPVGQVPVGGVSLPAFVGETGLEADEGGAGALVRLWRDQAMTAEDPPDGAAGGRWRSQAPGEVVQDRLRSAVVPGGKEVAPQLEDGGDHRLADRPWRGSRSA
jgi:hypothetical protein